jgi:hypothetical protein
LKLRPIVEIDASDQGIEETIRRETTRENAVGNGE